MKAFWNKRTIQLAIVVAASVCLVCALWWLAGRNGLARGGELGDAGGNPEESLEQFFDSYAEMTKKGEPDNILIVMSDSYPNGYGAKDIVEGPNQTYYLMYDSADERDEAYSELLRDDSVNVERNEKMQLMNYNSWGISQIGLDDAINAIGDGGEPVTVAVIDTGLDVELFREHFPDKALSLYNVEANSYEEADMFDKNGHGTHIAGTIAEGTSGNVSLYAIRASSGEKDTLYSTDVTTAIYKAVDEGAGVINMSIGAYSQIQSQKVALDYAVAHNVITVAAAGNDGKNDILYPAGYNNTLSIAAVDDDLSVASYSNYGEAIDFAAPGTGIVSINGIGNGTSMATPHAAAVVAALKSYNPELSFETVKNMLIERVQDLGTPGWDQWYGYGLVNLNDVDFCSEGDYCDEYGVFAVERPELNVDDRTNGLAEIVVLDDGIKVRAAKACIVLIREDGENYNRVVALADDDGYYHFEFETAGVTDVKVVLKGDLDMQGVVNARDSAKISYYLLSNDNPNHRDLTELELLIADINNSGTVTARDESLLNYALSSLDNVAHRDLEW